MDKADLEGLRKQALEEAEKQAKKERFGLFSYPPPLGLGSVSYAHTLPPRDPMNNLPITEKRNIFTGNVKKGNLPNVYLDGSFIKATEEQEKKGDPYVDPTKLKMGLIGPKGESLIAGKKTEGETKKKAFFPVVNKWNMYEGEDQEGKKQRRLGAPYFYPKSELKEVKKQIRDDKGKVIIENPNIRAGTLKKQRMAPTDLTNSATKLPDVGAGVTTSALANSQKWNSFYKEKRGGKYFKSTCHPKDIMTADKKFYAVPQAWIDQKIPVELQYTKKVKKVVNDNEEKKKPFKPSHPMRSGEKGYLGKFYRLVPPEQPKGDTVVRNKSADEPKRKAFKPARGYKSRPTPSIALNLMNVRSQLSGRP